MLTRIQDINPIFSLFDDFCLPLYKPFNERSIVECSESESERSMTTSFDVPGVKKENVEVTCEGRTIFVKATRGEKKYSVKYAVPRDYDASSAKCSLSDGVLSVKFDRAESSSKLRVIPIEDST